VVVSSVVGGWLTRFVSGAGDDGACCMGECCLGTEELGHHAGDWSIYIQEMVIVG
jgi:hypothetical protein